MRISDWSADVCSSDLRVLGIGALAAPAELDDDHLAILRYMRRQRLEIAGVAREPGHAQDRRRILAAFGPGIEARVQPDAVVRPPILVRPEIGSESWRERGCQYVEVSVVAETLKTKTNNATKL